MNKEAIIDFIDGCIEGLQDIKPEGWSLAVEYLELVEVEIMIGAGSD